jgi:hypothetical protein
VERVPEVGSSAEAAIMLGEAADADVAPGPPDVPAVPAPVATEAAAVLVGERSVAAGAETAEASALGASEEGGVETRSVPPGGSLIAVRWSPEGRRQLLRFRTREASDPVFVLDDEREDQSWDELRECAEATVGSLRALKGKCALGPFLSILVIECKHKCLNVNLCPWMNKVQITS